MKTQAGSTTRLIQLCAGYFAFYTITGLAVKYFLGSTERGLPGMNGIQYLLYSTAGAAPTALIVVFVRRWYRYVSNDLVNWNGLRFPREFLYIIPSGVCTAVVIPTTTLMYTLPVSVLVAMVIMRGAIIVVSRLVDAVQIRQGILKKRIYAEENWGVVFALLAVATKVIWPTLTLTWSEDAELAEAAGSFDFLRSKAAVTILSSYIVAYAIRIYIMNYFKNTVGRDVPRDNRGFFAIEQIAASATLVLVGALLIGVGKFGDWAPQIASLQQAWFAPRPDWPWAALSGVAFGVVAFFSVFIFMFKGRTATFVGLVNRCTSLFAGLAATLLFHWFFAGRFPTFEDWLGLVFLLVAVGLLARAESKRRRELEASQSVEIA